MNGIKLKIEDLVHETDSYPDMSGLEVQSEKIQSTDWDCLVILDACRFDAMKILMEQLGTGLDVEPVKINHNSETPDWVVENFGRENNWSNLTYVTGNLIHHSDWMPKKFDLSENVDELIDLGIGENSAWDNILNTARPAKVKEEALNHESPLIVHFMQPHTPFVGDIGLSLGSYNYSFLHEEIKAPDAYSLVEQDIVKPELVRAAYLENCLVAWEHAKDLINHFDKVVFTSDHGEALGPDEWGHPCDDERGKVVPWVESWK